MAASPLLTVATEVEAYFRDELQLVSDRQCDVCGAEAVLDDLGGIQKNLEHEPHCVYGKLRDAINDASARRVA